MDSPINVAVEPTPTVGRIVHVYNEHAGVIVGPFAAIITQVDDLGVYATVFVPHDGERYVRLDSQPGVKTRIAGACEAYWKWPPYVPPRPVNRIGVVEGVPARPSLAEVESGCRKIALDAEKRISDWEPTKRDAANRTFRRWSTCIPQALQAKYHESVVPVVRQDEERRAQAIAAADACEQCPYPGHCTTCLWREPKD